MLGKKLYNYVRNCHIVVYDQSDTLDNPSGRHGENIAHHKRVVHFEQVVNKYNLFATNGPYCVENVLMIEGVLILVGRTLLEQNRPKCLFHN